MPSAPHRDRPGGPVLAGVVGSAGRGTNVVNERFIWYADGRPDSFATTCSRLGIATLTREGKVWVLRYGLETAPTVVVIGWNAERVAKARAGEVLRAATLAVAS